MSLLSLVLKKSNSNTFLWGEFDLTVSLFWRAPPSGREENGALRCLFLGADGALGVHRGAGPEGLLRQVHEGVVLVANG